MTLYTAAITLILVMDPLGNIPVFLSVLNSVPSKKRPFIILREAFIAFVILTAFLFFGKNILSSLNISEPALGISGGIILFLIAIKMIFPNGENSQRDVQTGEPFIVPLAIPLLAGPSALATVLLIASQAPNKMSHWFVALAIATVTVTLILLFSNALRKFLGKKGLLAIERLMGMILTTVSVEMFLNGLTQYFKMH